MLEKIASISVIVILICMLFLNPKVSIIKILIKQLLVFKNAKNEKISVWDLVCFIFAPIVLAILLVFILGYDISNSVASVLTTVYAFVFTVLFGFAAVLVGKIDSKNELEKQVTEETFVSVLTSNILSLINAIASIILLNINEDSECVRNLVSAIIYCISFITIMLLLMITKEHLSYTVIRKRNKTISEAVFLGCFFAFPV